MEKAPDSILIIKLSAIGDVVHALPLLEVLGKNFPGAKIDWVVEEEACQIIEGHKGINDIIVSQRKSWKERLLRGRKRLGALREMLKFLRVLRSKEYDMVIDLQGLLKSAMLTGLSKGKRKIGTSWAREGSQLFLTERAELVDADEHAVDKYMKVADYLNCEKDSWKGNIPIRASDKISVDGLIRDHGLQEKILVGINPMAKWDTKLWEQEKFASIGDRLQKEFPCKVIFTGSKGDRAKIDQIIDKMEEEPINLAGQTTLKELAYLYSKCEVVISTDTGPMHIAAAMGCPVVALFGPTAPWRTGPYGKGHSVIREEMQCSPCFKRRCSDLTCMKNITVEKVLDRVKEHLNSTHP